MKHTIKHVLTFIAALLCLTGLIAAAKHGDVPIALTCFLLFIAAFICAALLEVKRDAVVRVTYRKKYDGEDDENEIK
jgi:hypothetical protein